MRHFWIEEKHGAALRSFVIATFLYLLSAKLSFFLAIPPGYSTPIWPAAGIALATALILGRAALPGILLGSFLANINPQSFWIDFQGISLERYALALAIACGAALQAWVATRLLFASPEFSPRLLRERDWLRIFTHGGLLACLCNSLIGTTSLSLAKSLGWSDFFFTWFTWWVGDLIGVLSFTPLFLVLSARSQRKQKSKFDHFLAILLGGFALTVLVFFYVRHLEEDKARKTFEHDALEIVTQIRDNFKAYESALLAIDAFFRSSKLVTRDEFHSFSEGFFPTLPGLIGLTWLPRLRYEELSEWEQRARAEGIPDYYVHDIVGDKKVPVPKGRRFYYPVFFIEPFDYKSPALGFDIGSEPIRLQAQIRASISGRPTATPPVPLLSGALGIVLSTPIYKMGEELPGDAGRLKGFIQGVFKIDDFMQSVIARTLGSKIEFSFGDANAGRNADLFTYAQDPGRLLAAWLKAQLQLEAEFSQDIRFELGGHPYRLLALLDNTALSSSRSWSTPLVLIGGTLFSGLLAITISIIISRTRETEELIEIKTTELQASNRELAKATQIKSQFLANMSHEIRTPLHGIVGNVELLLREDDPQERSRFASSIAHCSQMLTSIIDDILDFSKIEAGKLVLEQAPFSLKSLIDSTQKIIQTQASAKGLALNVSCEGPMTDALEGDSLRLRQIMINLLSNAVKFTREGSIDLKVWQESLEAGKLRLHVSVRDSGIGMSIEEQGKLFKDFSQVDTSTTRRFGGTGLGLVIAKQLCEKMGGGDQCAEQPRIRLDLQILR